MAVNVTLSPLPILQFFDNTGKPAVGGTLLTQVGGVNYATYSDAGGTTALPNPIPLNSRGEISTAAGASSELFLEDNVTYTFTLKDADGNQLWSIGNITSDSYMRLNYAAATGTNNLTATITGINAYENGLTVRLKFAATNTGTMTVNINSLGAINAYQTDGTSAIIAGQAIANNIGDFEYNSSLNSGAGGFVFLNPATVTGTFTATLTGMTTTTTGTMNYRIQGNMVTIWADSSILGTSNATTMTMTGVPAAIQPATTRYANPSVRDNGTFAIGQATMTASSGTWTFAKDPNSSAFTSSGSKGLAASALSYYL